MTQLSETGQTPPARGGIPLGALIGIVVLGVVGLGMLGFALLNVFGGAPATAPAPTLAAAVVTSLPTQAVVIPTATAAPAATATEAPTATPADAQPTAAPSGAALNILLNANVRAGPGTNYGILGGLTPGSPVQVTGRDSTATWYVVQYQGQQGWVSNQVAQYTGDINALPVVQAPPTPIAPVVAPTSPPAAATAAPTAAGPTGKGMRGDGFTIEKPSREFAVNEDIWFAFKVTNTTANAIAYRCLGAKIVGAAGAQCSWGNNANDTFNPFGVLEWRDHINIGTPGTYTLALGMCYLSDTGQCRSSVSNGWDILSGGVQIIVR